MFDRLLERSNWSAFKKVLAKWALVTIAWAGLISSCLSVFSYAAWIIDSCVIIYGWVSENFPRLVIILDSIEKVVDCWQSITLPVRDFLFGWLPFRIPRWVIDILVIVCVLASGAIRAWFATSDERQFAKAISPELSPEGRVALLKRIAASMTALNEARDHPDTNFGQVLGDKGEEELVMALDELTSGAKTGRKEDAVIDAIMDASVSDMKRMATYMQDYEEYRKETASKLVRRSVVIAVIFGAVIIIDLVYVMLR